MNYSALAVLLAKPPRRKPAGRPDGGQFAPTGGTSSKAELARQTSRFVDAAVQRYSEERCEPQLARGVGGRSLRDNEPTDVEVDVGGRKHGVELKVMTDNKQNKVYMKPSAQERKREWMRKNDAHFHTVVFDDQRVYKASGKHDESKRRIFYKRGVGNFRVNAMLEVRDMAELKALLSTPTAQLPASGRPSTAYREPRKRRAA
jgi:hypothetical protein